MSAYVIRRLLISLVILLLASFLMFVLVTNAGDPLADLQADQSPNKEAKIQARIDALNLDQPVPLRYLSWLSGAVQCFVPFGGCDLGTAVNGQEVTALVATALGSTLRLVLLATVLSIVLGVSVGILSALRQYSGFDYTITFLAFLFFSLPVFWVAVLLKQFLAIELNNWLSDPTFSWPFIIGAALVVGLTFAAIMGGGERKRQAIALAGAGLATAAVLLYWSLTGWWLNPSLGPLLVGLLAAGVSVAVTALLSGLDNRRVLATGLITVVVGVVVSLVGRPILVNPTVFGLFLLGAVVTVVGILAGWFLGGEVDRQAAVQVGVFSALAVGAFVFIDYCLANFANYSDKVGGRPVATIGSETPNFSGNLWETVLDQFLHLALPTIAIMLISFATYSRYTRASMLETLKADYVRTARAKGLPERTVVVRHAFRNALIPVTTLAALDFGAVIGGAVITETVFGWKGMGQLFREGLDIPDPNQVMGFFLVVAISVIVFNLLADLSYAWLDPRIRLD
jgi:peptide/nickel transport system permease protein